MKTIFFTGGGTLGPVTPLLAVYQELKSKVETRDLVSLQTVWVGTKNGPEREKLKLFPEVIFEYLSEAKLDRFISLRLFVAPLQFIAAVLKSVMLVIRYRPSIIVGSGGFMQVPLMWVGKQFGVSCLIHQIDVAPTLSNKLCAWAAKTITVNFEVTAKQFSKEKTVVVGNPVFIPEKAVIANERERSVAISHVDHRQNEIASSQSLLAMTKEDKPLLVVMGGGTGSEQLNRLVMLTADELTTIFNIILISGGRDVPGRGGSRPAPTSGLVVTNFVQDTYHLLERADLVVTRAGMATLTEVSCLGKPTVIVPIPHSHQEANARYFEERNAAEVLWCDYDETEKRAGEFVEVIKTLWSDGQRRDQFANNIRVMYNQRATQLITDAIVTLL